jgi:hypothetical protein
MKHYFWMKQSGGGCDYTIGCGEKLVELHGGTVEDRDREVVQLLEDYGINEDECRLTEAKILILSKDVMETVDEFTTAQRLAEHNQQIEEKRQQFERLKEELGEK